jgi:hypothetical protein
LNHIFQGGSTKAGYANAGDKSEKSFSFIEFIDPEKLRWEYDLWVTESQVEVI